MPKTLYIIDGHAQIYRAYYAPFRTLTAPSGEPTRATFLFTQMLLNLIRDRRPDYLAMALDADENKLLRRQIYPEYKATREPPPEDLPVQERRIIAILEAARIPMLRLEGWEADDLIATIARRHAEPDLQVFVVSRDKDLEQLITDHLHLYDPMKDEEIDAARLLEQKGWRPDQAVEAQILMGDDVDNVPGVAGIGPKTAAKLLQKYGTLAEIVAHADELSPKQGAALQAAVGQLDMTRQLVTLRTDVPYEFDLRQAECARFAWGNVRPIFEELGFRRLIEQLPSGGGTAADSSAVAMPAAAHASAASEATAEAVAAPTTTASAGEGEPAPLTGLAAELAAQLRVPDGGAYVLVNTPAALDTLAAALAGQKEFALDTETTGVNPMDCTIVGLSVSWEVGHGYYVALEVADPDAAPGQTGSLFGAAPSATTDVGQVLPLDLVRAKLGPLLADAKIAKVGQNLKYDLNVLRNAGLPVAGALFDTMIASFVLDPLRGSHSLDSLARNLLAHQMIPITDLIGKGRQQLTMDQVPVDKVAVYAAEDADYAWRLGRLFRPQLQPLGLDRLFYDVEMPLVQVLTDMEAHGISIDVNLLAELGGQMAARANALEREVHTLVGQDFNLDSPKQLAEVLFDKLKLPVIRRTKTTRSTDADTLETLAQQAGEPGATICARLLEYRELQKLRGTYIDALPLARSTHTGRIHTSYHQTGAVTGRLSSSEPNLQNIPIRTELGRQIRRAFVPRSPDEVLICADYSQVELRVLAHYCEDPALMAAFASDQDIHAFVAAQVNNVPLAEVTKEMRGRAKAVNFGIVYGQTAFGLSQQTGMGRGEAQAFIDAYFARYPRIRAFIDQCLAAARRDGYVRTILGRRRPIEGLDSRNANVRNQAERFAVNTVIQGSAADLIKIAMIRLHARIAAEQLPLRMLLQVHDELVCEAPRTQAPRLADTVRTVMSGALTLRVPLKVDVACGENWLAAK
jgi:DNA polymerase-1